MRDKKSLEGDAYYFILMAKNKELFLSCCPTGAYETYILNNSLIEELRYLNKQIRFYINTSTIIIINNKFDIINMINNETRKDVLYL